MSEEKIKRSHTYKSHAESLLRKLLPKFILTAAVSLGFTFFCLFSHASLDELTNKYINLFSAFILFLVFVIGWIFYVIFSFLAYRIHKKRIMTRGTQSSGKILRSQMIRKRGAILYSFTVRLESKEFFESEKYEDDYFKNENCTECTVFTFNNEHIISEFIETVTQKDEKKNEKLNDNKEDKKVNKEEKA